MSTALILPPIDVLATAAQELVNQASDKARINALNKAALQLHQGVTPVLTAGGMLVESRTRNLVHRVDWVKGCGCEAGQAQRPCWHAALVEIVEQAQIRCVPTVVRERAAILARQAAAEAALLECY